MVCQQPAFLSPSSGMAPSAGSSPSSLPPALAASLYLHLDSCVLTLPLFRLLLNPNRIDPSPSPSLLPSPPQACHLRLPSYSSIWLYLSVIQPTKRGKTGREGFWFTDISLLVLRLESGEEGGQGRWRVLGKTRKWEGRTKDQRGSRSGDYVIANRRYIGDFKYLVEKEGIALTRPFLIALPPFLLPARDPSLVQGLSTCVCRGRAKSIIPSSF
jgi:hypothetical protein